MTAAAAVPSPSWAPPPLPWASWAATTANAPRDQEPHDLARPGRLRPRVPQPVYATPDPVAAGRVRLDERVVLVPHNEIRIDERVDARRSPHTHLLYSTRIDAVWPGRHAAMSASDGSVLVPEDAVAELCRRFLPGPLFSSTDPANTKGESRYA